MQGVETILKLELLSNTILDIIMQRLDVIDFDALEAIVCIFEKYNINAGARHNFG